MVIPVDMLTKMEYSHMVLPLDEQLSAVNDFREMGNQSALRMSPPNIHINHQFQIVLLLGMCICFLMFQKNSMKSFAF